MIARPKWPSRPPNAVIAKGRNREKTRNANVASEKRPNLKEIGVFKVEFSDPEDVFSTTSLVGILSSLIEFLDPSLKRANTKKSSLTSVETGFPH